MARGEKHAGGSGAGGSSPDAGEVDFPSIDVFPAEDDATPVPKVTPSKPQKPPVPFRSGAAPPAPAPAPAGPNSSPAPGPSSRRKAAESQGRSSASYASARPHQVAPAHVQATDQPAVIVDPHEAAPPISQNQTLRLADAPPRSSPGGGFPVSASAQQTVRLPWAPSQGPPVRRGHNPTMVVRQKRRGKGGAEKIVAFFGVLVAVIAIGAIVFYVLDSTTRPKAPSPQKKPQKTGQRFLDERAPAAWSVSSRG
jgi:hypothetical protein